MSQISSKTLYIDLDLKNYFAPKQTLLQMVKDEIKGSNVLKFGYQEIGLGEEVFFAISTKHFKNFEFEKTSNQQETRLLDRSNLLNKKTNRILEFAKGRLDPGKLGRRGNFLQNERFMNTEYNKWYGDFEIVVWMLVQVTFNPPESDTNPGGIRFIVKCISEKEEIYKEIDEKIQMIIKEFEKKIITRIILLRLNESREWPKDLCVNEVDFNRNFMKMKPAELKKPALSVMTNSDASNTSKKIKKVKKTRMEQWAKKIDELKLINEPSMISPKTKTIDLTEEVTEDHTQTKQTSQREEIKEEKEPEIPKYEIKLVYTHKYTTNINIKTIDNLSILKNLEVNNMKNVFVIKNNYKTYIFTLTDSDSEGKDQSVKASNISMCTDVEKLNNKTSIYLNVYGISDPNKEFITDIVFTIGTQIDQLALMQRAKNIYRTKPKASDYEFINEK